MEGKIRLAVFGQKRLSREGGIEIVVKELCTRMAQNGCEVTCYNRAGHHVSGAEYDKTIEYDGIRQKVVPTIEKKGLAAVSSMNAICDTTAKSETISVKGCKVKITYASADTDCLDAIQKLLQTTILRTAGHTVA